jgi:hypothetical protein
VTTTIMSEVQKTSDSLIPETPVQNITPPEIQITAPAANTGVPLIWIVADQLESAPVAAEQHTIPEASTALPGTVAAETQNTEPPTPTSPTSPTAPGESGTSENNFTNTPFKSIVRSFTQPTTGKPADGNVSASVDPKTGVAQVEPYFGLLICQPHENFTPKENFGLVGQQAKAKMRRVFCCGGKDDLQS